MSEIDHKFPDAYAEIVLPAGNLSETIQFFVEQLGFRLDTIIPADDPSGAQLSGFGLRLNLDGGYRGSGGVICIRTHDSVARQEITAPNGTTVKFLPAALPLEIPQLQPSLCIQKLSDPSGAWKVGRAGMEYRDLIPDRQGGRFIASHIRIPEGGPVPDNVHYHHIRFQMIYCYRGWVQLVYEDQGEPFFMRAGDCVLQPPHIRHRVLESSDGLEVIEIGSPAKHMTHIDHEMQLPTGRYLPDRDYRGQRYQFHRADNAQWQSANLPGFDSCDLGIADATQGLADVQVIRRSAQVDDCENLSIHDKELAFSFVLEGNLTLTIDQTPDISLSAGDSFTVPAGLKHAYASCSDDLRLLQVSLPA